MTSSTRNDFSRTALLLLPALIVYGILSWQYNFVQDDAFISYRFVANFLNGDGLVFNIGERVEGYTNHGWVILLSMIGSLGLDYILLSQIIGFLCGLGLIWVAYYIVRELDPRAPEWLAAGGALLVSACPSLAYWSGAGLETSAFALVMAASVLFFLRGSRLLPWGILMAVLLRPEGALLAALLIAIGFYADRRLGYITIGHAILAFVLALPMVGFKLFYYGALLPNPFFAKTGWSTQQLALGWDYVVRFFSHYPVLLLGLVLPLLFYRRLGRQVMAVWIFVALWTVYLLAIGGDVLKVHRFFLPILSLLATLLVVSLHKLLAGGMSGRSRSAITLVIIIAAGGMSIAVPRSFVNRYYTQELQLHQKMVNMAETLKKIDQRNFSVGLTTIGAFGYELTGHRVIDMLGLTDSAIARHPAAVVSGISSTWYERSFNSRYLLSQRPDYIVFSTDYKPSAPAEQDLLRYPDFRRSYRARGWIVGDGATGSPVTRHAVFKQVRPINEPIEPDIDGRIAERFRGAMDLLQAGQPRAALQKFHQAASVTPGDPYPYALLMMATLYQVNSEHETARNYYKVILSEDSLVSEAHTQLYLYAASAGDTTRMQLHRNWIKQLEPWNLAWAERRAASVRRAVEKGREGDNDG